MARFIWVSALFLILALPAPGKPGSAESPAQALTIRMDQDRLTLNANDVPQRRLLEELAKRLNFELILAGPLEERRSLDIDARPWEEALKKALSPASWAFVYDSSGGEPRLTKVFVFPSKDDGSGSIRPPSIPARVATPAPMPAPNPQGRQASRPAAQENEPSMAEMLTAEDEETRALAVIGLAAVGGEESVPALRQALQDKEAWIRETAVEALAEIGGEQAIQGLQQALRDDNEEVRKEAQEALIKLQPNPQ
jgi:hypothetical protein